MRRFRERQARLCVAKTFSRARLLLHRNSSRRSFSIIAPRGHINPPDVIYKHEDSMESNLV